jgi:hypothetical protein
MKVKVVLLLHLLGLDGLLLGLFEKLALDLTKKLLDWSNAIRNLVDEVLAINDEVSS